MASLTGRVTRAIDKSIQQRSPVIEYATVISYDPDTRTYALLYKGQTLTSVLNTSSLVVKEGLQVRLVIQNGAVTEVLPL